MRKWTFILTLFIAFALCGCFGDNGASSLESSSFNSELSISGGVEDVSMESAQESEVEKESDSKQEEESEEEESEEDYVYPGPY